MDLTFDHLHFFTADPEAVAAWFKKILDAEVIGSPQRGQPRVDIKVGGQKMFISQIATDEKLNAAPESPHRGLDHFGFFVKDIDAVFEDLKKRGADITKAPHTPRPGIRIMFLRGPDELSIELLERDEKYR